MNILVINTQSFGDVMLSTHIARVAKQYLPEAKVHFFVKEDMTLTTAETSTDAKQDMLKLIAMQDNISSVGYVNFVSRSHVSFSPILGTKPNNNELFQTIFIQGWSSDLGIVKSQLKPFYDAYKILDPINTETKFNVGSTKIKEEQLVVGLAGDLDFLRKWHNQEEYKKFVDQISLKKYNIKIEKFGVDVESSNYSTQLRRLNNCNLLIAPIGSLVHIAAGLDVDTISLTSVFPAKYDCPEFYHSGWHKHVKAHYPLHCDTFLCIKNKVYDNQQTWGNPPTEFGFWPKECIYTQNAMSCNYNIIAEQLIEKFEEWYNENS